MAERGVIVSLPEVWIGGREFIDISGIVGPDRYQRPRTDALLVHHAGAGSAIDADLNFNGTTEDEEIAWIRSVNAYHANLGWGGFGYQAVSFPSTRVYTVGRCLGARAHIASQNDRYAGIVMPGDWSTSRPPQGVVDGLRRWASSMRVELGALPIGGHRDYALLSDPTSCPGDGGIAILQELEDDMTDDERELLRLLGKTFLLDAAELAGDEEAQTALMLDRLRRYHGAVPTSLSGRLSNLEARLDA